MSKTKKEKQRDLEPVNPTNPNALENQPGGNGNGKSTLHDLRAEEPDSNEVQGKPQQVEQSLSSGPAAVSSGEGKQ